MEKASEQAPVAIGGKGGKRWVLHTKRLVQWLSCQPLFVSALLMNGVTDLLFIPVFLGKDGRVVVALALEVVVAVALLLLWRMNFTALRFASVLFTMHTVYAMSQSTTMYLGPVETPQLCYYNALVVVNGGPTALQILLFLFGGAVATFIANDYGMGHIPLIITGLSIAARLGHNLSARGSKGYEKHWSFAHIHLVAVAAVFARHVYLMAQAINTGTQPDYPAEGGFVVVFTLLAVVIDVSNLASVHQKISMIADVMPPDASAAIMKHCDERGIEPGQSVPIDNLQDISASIPYHRNHESVSILFMDVVGFTSMCSERPPLEVMNMLHELYCYLDWHARDCKVYKVETIGDCYMVACGLEPTDPDDHADHVLCFAQRAVLVAQNLGLTVRCGIDTGPITSGVVGLYRHRFCLFGDTVNTASRMETNAVHNGIHISNATYSALRNKSKLLESTVLDVPGRNSRASIASRIEKIKGKGTMVSYDVSTSRRAEHVRGPKTEKPQTPRSSGSFGLDSLRPEGAHGGLLATQLGEAINVFSSFGSASDLAGMTDEREDEISRHWVAPARSAGATAVGSPKGVSRPLLRRTSRDARRRLTDDGSTGCGGGSPRTPLPSPALGVGGLPRKSLGAPKDAAGWAGRAPAWGGTEGELLRLRSLSGTSTDGVASPPLSRFGWEASPVPIPNDHLERLLSRPEAQ